MANTRLDGRLPEFFARLDDGDAESASQFFTPDGLYVRPASDPSGATTARTEVVSGRDAIRDYFRERGLRPYRHHIQSCVRAGGLEYADGVAIHESSGPFAVFVVRAELETDGRFRRYVAGAVALSAPDITRLYPGLGRGV
jgi:ketosteroid isomerase-like protein